MGAGREITLLRGRSMTKIISLKVLRKGRVFAAAFALAAAMFWGTMLTVPPTSEAAFSSSEANAPFVEAGRIVDIWLEQVW